MYLEILSRYRFVVSARKGAHMLYYALYHDGSPIDAFDVVSPMAEYDRIAREYRASKRLAFREYVERYTLFELLGDVGGKTVLDLACGEGFYARLLRQAGARQVTGVDVSAAMIKLAEAEERRNPLGCRYVRADAAVFRPEGPVDVVVAAYLLNYARTPRQLLRFCRTCHEALRPGGRVVSCNNNVLNVSSGPVSFRKYGLERTWARPLAEGDAIRYTLFNVDGTRAAFDNFYLSPETHAEAFERAGFREFRWVDVSLHPSQAGNPFWDDFMADPPIVAFEAER